MYRQGWFQVAFESELSGDITPISIESKRLVIVRRQGRLGAFEADCPHRGMHLAVGGRVVGNAIVCPFHGLRIGLGQGVDCDYAVREYPLLKIQDLIFVRLSESRENGLSAGLGELSENHRFVPGLCLRISATAALVMENGVDQRHFGSVHGVTTTPFVVARADTGPLTVKGTFRVPSGSDGAAKEGAGLRNISYNGQFFSPGIYLAQLGHGLPSHLGRDLDMSFKTLTSATEHDADGSCTIRLTFVVRDGITDEMLESFSTLSLRGIEDDRRMWENVNPNVESILGPEDEPILAFRRYCDGFR